MAAVTDSPSPFGRLRDLFDRLSETPYAEREAELERLDDPALAAELRGMLEASARSTTALDRAVLLLAEDAVVVPQVPGFLIQRRIGRGGSATVYLAEQERAEFSRQVALKVVDRVFDPESLRRVRDEQRILAKLEHPGIARLYDAGVTANGQPYLAMELVEGETLLEHCRVRKLPVRQRLELFVTVLDAVSFAHERGVVHRDLKPANILVSARGEAKLLDFGIAKLAAQPGAEVTQTQRRVMTPAYASPEQLRGERVEASSDIYSLGVVLYELLTETSPYRLDSQDVETLAEAIRSQDPEPPSSATARITQTVPQPDRGEYARRRRELRGDLDAVVLKTLRKERSARYLTVAALAEDLRRYLAHQPVGARRGSWRYRARKLVRRHRAVVLTTAAALGLLLALASVPQVRSWWMGSAARRPGGEFARFYAARAADRQTRHLLEAGATALAAHDATAAASSFQQAAERAPEEALAWDGLARAESARGDLGRAAAAAVRAGSLSGPLDADERELLRARSLVADRKWAEAIPALEGIFGRLPDRVDVGLDLLAALLASGRNVRSGHRPGSRPPTGERGRARSAHRSRRCRDRAQADRVPARRRGRGPGARSRRGAGCRGPRLARRTSPRLGDPAPRSP